MSKLTPQERMGMLVVIFMLIAMFSIVILIGNILISL